MQQQQLLTTVPGSSHRTTTTKSGDAAPAKVPQQQPHWTESDDLRLVELVASLGSKWSAIQRQYFARSTVASLRQRYTRVQTALLVANGSVLATREVIALLHKPGGMQTIMKKARAAVAEKTRNDLVSGLSAQSSASAANTATHLAMPFFDDEEDEDNGDGDAGDENDDDDADNDDINFLDEEAMLMLDEAEHETGSEPGAKVAPRPESSLQKKVASATVNNNNNNGNGKKQQPRATHPEKKQRGLLSRSSLLQLSVSPFFERQRLHISASPLPFGEFASASVKSPFNSMKLQQQQQRQSAMTLCSSHPTTFGSGGSVASSAGGAAGEQQLLQRQQRLFRPHHLVSSPTIQPTALRGFVSSPTTGDTASSSSSSGFDAWTAPQPRSPFMQRRLPHNNTTAAGNTNNTSQLRQHELSLLRRSEESAVAAGGGADSDNNSSRSGQQQQHQSLLLSRRRNRDEPQQQQQEQEQEQRQQHSYQPSRHLQQGVLGNGWLQRTEEASGGNTNSSSIERQVRAAHHFASAVERQQNAELVGLQLCTSGAASDNDGMESGSGSEDFESLRLDLNNNNNRSSYNKSRAAARSVMNPANSWASVAEPAPYLSIEAVQKLEMQQQYLREQQRQHNLHIIQLHQQQQEYQLLQQQNRERDLEEAVAATEAAEAQPHSSCGVGQRPDTTDAHYGYCDGNEMFGTSKKQEKSTTTTVTIVAGANGDSSRSSGSDRHRAAVATTFHGKAISSDLVAPACHAYNQRVMEQLGEPYPEQQQQKQQQQVVAAVVSGGAHANANSSSGEKNSCDPPLLGLPLKYVPNNKSGTSISSSSSSSSPHYYPSIGRGGGAAGEEESREARRRRIVQQQKRELELLAQAEALLPDRKGSPRAFVHPIDHTRRLFDDDSLGARDDTSATLALLRMLQDEEDDLLLLGRDDLAASSLSSLSSSSSAAGAITNQLRGLLAAHDSAAARALRTRMLHRQRAAEEARQSSSSSSASAMAATGRFFGFQDDDSAGNSNGINNNSNDNAAMQQLSRLHQIGGGVLHRQAVAVSDFFSRIIPKQKAPNEYLFPSYVSPYMSSPYVAASSSSPHSSSSSSGATVDPYYASDMSVLQRNLFAHSTHSNNRHSSAFTSGRRSAHGIKQQHHHHHHHHHHHQEKKGSGLSLASSPCSSPSLAAAAVAEAGAEEEETQHLSATTVVAGALLSSPHRSISSGLIATGSLSSSSSSSSSYSAALLIMPSQPFDLCSSVSGYVSPRDVMLHRYLDGVCSQFNDSCNTAGSSNSAGSNLPSFASASVAAAFVNSAATSVSKLFGSNASGGGSGIVAELLDARPASITLDTLAPVQKRCPILCVRALFGSLMERLMCPDPAEVMPWS